MSTVEKSALHKKHKPDILTMGILAFIIVAILSYTAIKASRNVSDKSVEACTSERPNLLLAPVTLIGSSKLGKDTALIIDNYFHTGLSQYSMINLVSGDTDCSNAGAPSYTLKTEIFGTASQPYISMIVHHSKTQKIVFSEKIDLPKENDVRGQEFSWKFYKLASNIAYSSGVIPQNAALQPWANTVHKDAYLCQNLAYKYFATVAPSTEFSDAITCMEYELENGSPNLEIHGLLAMFYMEQARGYQPYSTQDPLRKADEILRHAEEIDPFSKEVLLARTRLESERTVIDTARLRQLLYSLERQQTYNPHVLIFVAQMSGFKLGDWPYAQEISQRTLQIDRTNAFSVYYVELGHALLFSDAQAAYDISLKLYEPKSIISVLMCLASANKAGITTPTEQYKTDLATLGLTSTAHYTKFITGRHYEPALTQELLKWVSVEN